MPLSQSDLQKVDQMQENLIAYFRLFAGLPGITFTEAAEVTWIVTAKGAPGNQVLRTQAPADSIDRVIDEIMVVCPKRWEFEEELELR